MQHTRSACWLCSEKKSTPLYSRERIDQQKSGESCTKEDDAVHSRRLHLIYHEKANQLWIGFFRLNDNANNQD